MSNLEVLNIPFYDDVSKVSPVVMIKVIFEFLNKPSTFSPKSYQLDRGEHTLPKVQKVMNTMLKIVRLCKQ